MKSQSGRNGRLVVVLLHLWLVGVATSNILDSTLDRLEPIDLAKAAETIKMLAAKEKPEKVASKVQLKAHLKHYCDIYTEGPICMGEGARIISKAMNMQGIVGDYVFDQKITVDRSGFSNMVVGTYDVRPGKLGIGSAAFFKSKTFLKLDHLKEYNSNEFSVVLWVYIDHMRVREAECPIFLKGEDNPAKKQFERGPGVFIDQKTGTVYAYVSKESLDKGESARTLGYIRPKKWTQITAVFTSSAIKLYLNGVLDGYIALGSGGNIKQNNKPIYIGGHPNQAKNCSLEPTIDSVKMYNRELKVYEIQASVRQPFGIIEPSYFHLACFDCYYSQAKSKCVTNYKLCSAADLYSGVWQAAQIMGWTDQNYYIFTDGSINAEVKGMGICCREELY